MTIATIAKQLNIPPKTFEKESAAAWLSKRLLQVESELLQLANKYGAKTAAQFLAQARKGKIGDTADTMDDFFKLDHLEAEYKRLRTLQKQI